MNDTDMYTYACTMKQNSKTMHQNQNDKTQRGIYHNTCASFIHAGVHP